MNNTLTYPWYIVGKTDELQQGDLIFDCPIIDVSESHSEDFANLKDGDEIEIIPEVKKVNLIILTQSCDLANDKIDQVLLCAVTLGSEYGNNLGNIKKSRMVSLCAIEGCEDNDFSFEQQVIDFRAVYTLPKKYISTFAELRIRARLLPPYREFVSQAFARFFMRVGLPKDIV